MKKNKSRKKNTFKTYLWLRSLQNKSKRYQRRKKIVERIFLILFYKSQFFLHFSPLEERKKVLGYFCFKLQLCVFSLYISHSLFCCFVIVNESFFQYFIFCMHTVSTFFSPFKFLWNRQERTSLEIHCVNIVEQNLKKTTNKPTTTIAIAIIGTSVQQNASNSKRFSRIFIWGLQYLNFFFLLLLRRFFFSLRLLSIYLYHYYYTHIHITYILLC